MDQEIAESRKNFSSVLDARATYPAEIIKEYHDLIEEKVEKKIWAENLDTTGLHVRLGQDGKTNKCFLECESPNANTLSDLREMKGKFSMNKMLGLGSFRRAHANRPNVVRYEADCISHMVKGVNNWLTGEKIDTAEIDLLDRTRCSQVG